MDMDDTIPRERPHHEGEAKKLGGATRMGDPAFLHHATRSTTTMSWQRW